MAEKRLTYRQLGEILGVSREAARQRAMRARWPRTVNNEGEAIVIVDEHDLERAVERQADTRPTPEPEVERPAVELPSNPLLDQVLGELRQQLERASERAERAHGLEVSLVRIEGELRLVAERAGRLEADLGTTRAERDAERRRTEELVEALRDAHEKLTEATRPKSLWRRIVG